MVSYNIHFLFCTLFMKAAVPRFQQFIASFSLRRPTFNTRSVHVGFLVDKVSLRQGFYAKYFDFPCQYHSTHALDSFNHH
jgi:hypothetical protein